MNKPISVYITKTTIEYITTDSKGLDVTVDASILEGKVFEVNWFINVGSSSGTSLIEKFHMDTSVKLSEGILVYLSRNWVEGLKFEDGSTSEMYIATFKLTPVEE